MHSYLVHLNDSSVEVEGISLFIDAASMITNINYIYQMRVNQLHDNIMKLSKKILNQWVFIKNIFF